VVFFFLILHREVQKVGQQVWITLGSVVIIAGSAYPVFSKDTKAGHDLFSSEKPQVILEVQEAQEAKRKEYRRQLMERRVELETEEEALKKILKK